MFDPTAYENMKVVIEGYLYDKDLEGELSIVDRNDIINLAKLSREYAVHFKLRATSKEHIASFCLKAGIENLSAELLEGNIIPKNQGCIVELQFIINHLNEPKVFEKLQTGMQNIWGENRTIQQMIQVNPLQKNVTVQNKVSINFNRIIIEDQIDDLIDMADHMLETLIWLETFFE
jgi:hypothetical protein